MKRLFAHALVAAAVLWTVGAVAPSAPAATDIRPGTFISTPVGGCTASFVFDGPSQVFMATAAHCVQKVGDPIALLDGTVFGHAALIGDADFASTDWALIQIDAAYVPRVGASVIGHSSTPTGIARSSRAGDEVLYSGYGIPWEATGFTRTNRFGFMVWQSSRAYELVGSDTWGDSGGPIVLARTGSAMGLVSRVCVGVCTSVGPTVQAIVDQAAAKGVPVKLRTATP